MLGSRSSTNLWRHLLGVVVWTLLATGLFAMHGLGNHGTGSHLDTAQPVSADLSAQLGMHGSFHSASDVQESAPTSSGTPGLGMSQHSSPDPMGELVSMCLAILLGVLAGFAAALLGHLERRPLARAARTVQSTVIVGRDRDPPCLVRLSVMRC